MPMSKPRPALAVVFSGATDTILFANINVQVDCDELGYSLDDIVLTREEPPPGMSMFDGMVQWWSGNDGDFDATYMGSWRQLTPEELATVLAGIDPWKAEKDAAQAEEEAKHAKREAEDKAALHVLGAPMEDEP